MNINNIKIDIGQLESPYIIRPSCNTLLTNKNSIPAQSSETGGPATQECGTQIQLHRRLSPQMSMLPGASLRL